MKKEQPQNKQQQNQDPIGKQPLQDNQKAQNDGFRYDYDDSSDV